MADLGHLCDPTPVHLQWVQRLEEEFFMQGDAEQAAGMPITPLFDRTKPGVTKSQVAFMDIVAIPLFKAMTEVYHGTEPFLEGVSAAIMHKCGFNHWKFNGGTLGAHAQDEMQVTLLHCYIVLDSANMTVVYPYHALMHKPCNTANILTRHQIS
jgi:hypothetical protein